MRASIFPRARCGDRRPFPTTTSRRFACRIFSSPTAISTSRWSPNSPSASWPRGGIWRRGQPLIGGIATPTLDADAYIAVHPGAAAFYNGTQQSFMDRWGNVIYLTPMVLGALASIFAAAWRFLGIRGSEAAQTTLEQLCALRGTHPRPRGRGRTAQDRGRDRHDASRAPGEIRDGEEGGTEAWR